MDKGVETHDSIQIKVDSKEESSNTLDAGSGFVLQIVHCGCDIRACSLSIGLDVREVGEGWL